MIKKNKTPKKKLEVKTKHGMVRITYPALSELPWTIIKKNETDSGNTEMVSVLGRNK